MSYLVKIVVTWLLTVLLGEEPRLNKTSETQSCLKSGDAWFKSRPDTEEFRVSARPLSGQQSYNFLSISLQLKQHGKGDKIQTSRAFRFWFLNSFIRRFH